MRAKDVMTSHPILVSAAKQDRVALRRLMEDADIHHLPIVEDGHLLGVWGGDRRRPRGDASVATASRRSPPTPAPMPACGP